MVAMLASKEEFNKAMQDAGDKVVAIDFTASWCGPCKMIGPKFEKFAGEYQTIVFYKVDVDEASDVAEQEGIRAMPTFKFYKNGQKVEEMCGASEEKLKEILERFK